MGACAVVGHEQKPEMAQEINSTIWFSPASATCPKSTALPLCSTVTLSATRSSLSRWRGPSARQFALVLQGLRDGNHRALRRGHSLLVAFQQGGQEAPRQGGWPLVFNSVAPIRETVVKGLRGLPLVLRRLAPCAGGVHAVLGGAAAPPHTLELNTRRVCASARTRHQFCDLMEAIRLLSPSITILGWWKPISSSCMGA